MESFYGDVTPRELPQASSFYEISLDSQMSNLSLLADKQKRSIPTSYNLWKLENENRVTDSNLIPSQARSNYDIVGNQTTDSSLIKKQVRFNVQGRSENCPPMPLNNHQQPINNYFNCNDHRNPALELSVIEPRPPLCQLNTNSNTYGISNSNIQHNNLHPIDFTIVPFKERGELCKNKMCTCEPKTYNEWRIQNVNKQSASEIITKKPSEPTMSSLYDIIKNQNEDLKKLQKQVEMLLQRTESPKIPIIEKQCCCEQMIKEKQNITEAPKQISIGVMTSFELNSVNRNNNEMITNQEEIGNASKKTDYNVLEERQKQELLPQSNITELSKNKEFSLNDIVELTETSNETQTPMSSIHVNLDEYSDNSSDESDEENIPNGNIGWTIYKNVVGQVKNILQKSPPCNEQFDGKVISDTNEEVYNKKTPRFKDRLVWNKKHGDSIDLSIEINQLVMKYLQDDQLSFLVSKSQFVHPIKNVKQPSPYVINNNEISMATVKYMQKYHWGQSNKPKMHCGNEERKMPIPLPRTKQGSKILDITVLKQQPKLL